MLISTFVTRPTGGRPCQRRVVVLCALGFFTFAGPAPTRGQIEQSKFDGENAHVHSPDGSCCKPCVATERDSDPDVFKRPCFVRALSRSREAFGVYRGLTGGPYDGMKVPVERIPIATFTAMQSVLTEHLQPEYLPRNWDDVYGLAQYPVKTVTEMRNGVATFVRNELDLTAEVTQLKQGDAIQAAWLVDGIEVLPRISFGPTPPGGVLVRLRLFGQERVDFRLLSLEEKTAPGYDHQPQDVIDKPALLSLLKMVFRIPFETTDDFLVRNGPSGVVEGIRVFNGRIKSRRGWDPSSEVNRREPRDDQAVRTWYNEVQLFVTDSEPQYICLSLDLREEQ